MKNMTPFALWMLRIGFAIFGLTTYLNAFLAFSFKTLGFYIAAIYVVFGILLFVGGFLSKSILTIISALLIFLASVYEMFVVFKGGVHSQFAVYFIIAAAAFYFVTVGNKK